MLLISASYFPKYLMLNLSWLQCPTHPPPPTQVLQISMPLVTSMHLSCGLNQFHPPFHIPSWGQCKRWWWGASKPQELSILWTLSSVVSLPLYWVNHSGMAQGTKMWMIAAHLTSLIHFISIVWVAIWTMNCLGNVCIDKPLKGLSWGHGTGPLIKLYDCMIVLDEGLYVGKKL